MSTKAERAEAASKILQHVKRGDTLYVIRRHTSKEGAQRLSFYAIRDNKPVNLTELIATVIGRPYTPKNKDEPNDPEAGVTVVFNPRFASGDLANQTLRQLGSLLFSNESGEDKQVGLSTFWCKWL